MRKRKPNPANAPGIDKRLWLFAVKHPGDYVAMNDFVKIIEFDETTSKYSATTYAQLAQDRKSYERQFWANVVNRIPQRNIDKKPSFRFRSYQKMWVYDKQYWVPNVNTSELKHQTFGYEYQPILKMKEKLKQARLRLVKNRADGLIRWTETINEIASSIVVAKDFSNFEFRINSGNFSNSLPTIKTYGSLSVHVKAPAEFWKESFWGNAEFLVVQIHKTWINDFGFSVKECTCLPRMALYKLNAPQEFQTRFFVSQGRYYGHGLSENAAMRSVGLKLSKVITEELS